MLVLRRTCGQSIVIGERGEVVVKILRDENGIIFIGINAPKSILVDRLEIFEKRSQSLQASNESSMNIVHNECLS